MSRISMVSNASASQLLDESGIWTGSFSVIDGQWREFRTERRAERLSDESYFVSRRPLDVHCHGVGRFDFTDIEGLDLAEIERNLEAEDVQCVLTLYLPQPSFGAFLRLVDAYDAERRQGRLPHITGFAIEGPVLASHGGTPGEGVWMPTMDEWRRLAACGGRGLLYMVISPDAVWPADGSSPPDVNWITDALLDGGVLPAVGHFTKGDPAFSARRLQEMVDRVERAGRITLSDHLFNDMPRLFKHAWRGADERARREAELAAVGLPAWSFDNLDRTAGVVPATLMRAARAGIVKPCINFDGEHVDLAIAKRVVELLGAENLIGMTDRIDSKRLAGRDLHMPGSTTLLYQDQGIVAAGTQGFDRQRDNMLSIGLSEQEIWTLFAFTPRRVLRSPHDTGDERPAAGVRYAGSFVERSGNREVVAV